MSARVTCGAIALTCALCLGAAPSTAGAQTMLAVGTGSTSGVYFQVGRSLCRLLAAGGFDGTCTAVETPGSIANLEDLRAGTLQIAVVQSDWQYHAVKGSGPFAKAGPDEGLRALFSLYDESFTVVARQDAGIASFDDLAGKRVNVGNPGSGQRATMEVVMAAKGWTDSVFALANDLPASQQSLALCHDRVQAMVYVVGHPNASVAHATNLCAARIVPVTGPAIDELVSRHPYYSRTQVPGGLYAANPDPVPTFGVTATVVASTALDESVAHEVVSTVFGQIAVLRRMNPAFGALDPARMAVDGLSAPLHDGARRYFDENGIAHRGAR